MERDVMLNVRVPSAIKTALQRAAADDHGRSMSGMVVRILSEWLSENGYRTTTPAAERRRKRS